MNDSRERRAKEIQKAISDVLYREWDPIGVRGIGPGDEYDSYVAPIYRLLTSGASKEEVASRLKKIEGESMGLHQAKETALLPVAESLLAIDLRLVP